MHLHIFSSNILLDEHLVAVLADFGFSIQLPVQLPESKTLITVGPGEGLPGTPGYRAPEYNDGHYSTYSDVYAYGVVCSILLYLSLCCILLQVALETYSGLLAFSKQRPDQNLVLSLINFD